MSNNDNQQVELTDIATPLREATPGLTMEDRDASIGLLLDFAERGRNRGVRLPSICKVPSILRDLNESSFNPQLVSIGPIHRENEKLKEFEWLKGCYLHDLLNRRGITPNEILEACLLKVITLIPQIRESYNAGVIENYSDVELATMMVKDGCFILEFCFKHDDEDLYLPNKMQNLRIAMDLMLLENQVPFFVLQALFDCSMGKESFTLSDILDTYLTPYIKLFWPLPEKKSILKLFCSLLPETILTTDVDSDFPENIPTTDFDSDSTHEHVLGYLYKRYQLGAAKSSKPKLAEALKLVDEDEELAAKSSKPIRAESSNPIKNAPFLSIVELGRSGMKFKPHQEDVWSMTIKFQPSLFACLPWFWSTPTLLMPTLVIDDTTELILRNFIAYEQSFPQGHYHFTSYAVAMDMLIDTEEDIAKLVESKVLVNDLGSNQEAADMINNICKNMFVTDFCYIQAFKQMHKYYNGYWPKNIARLRGDFEWVRHTYLNNSWKAIALFASITLFFLTVVQTLYTIRAA